MTLGGVFPVGASARAGSRVETARAVVSPHAPETREGRELAPTGINVVAETDSETMYETYDARFAVNVNRLSDADLAEASL